jgi:glycosyltransferase involved in cell wall biosynthesis
LIQTYTLPYVEIIRKILPSSSRIVVVTAEQRHIALTEDEKKKLNDEWDKKNMELYTLSYKRYGIRKFISFARQFISLLWLVRRKRTDAIHAVCTPAGSIGFLLSRLTGRPLVIDSFEPHAEAMVENGSWKKNGFAYRALFRLERWQAKRASYIISAAAGMEEYALKKYDADISAKMFVKGACVDTKKFYPRPKDPRLLNELGLENKIVCVYAGKLGGIYHEKEVFDFIRSCYDHWGEKFRMLMLTNTKREDMERQMQSADVPAHILISRFVSHPEVPVYMSLADFGLTPVKPVPTKKYCTPIKDGEYWAMGLPVVITPGISDDSEIIAQKNIGVVVDLRKKEFHKDAIQKLDSLLSEDKEHLHRKIFSVALQYRSFEIPEKIYPAIYGTR